MSVEIRVYIDMRIAGLRKARPIFLDAVPRVGDLVALDSNEPRRPVQSVVFVLGVVPYVDVVVGWVPGDQDVKGEEHAGG